MSDLQQDVERDLARGRRWARAYVVFGVAVSALVTLALLVFYAVREWVIWR